MTIQRALNRHLFREGKSTKKTTMNRRCGPIQVLGGQFGETPVAVYMHKTKGPRTRRLPAQPTKALYGQDNKPIGFLNPLMARLLVSI
jgi:hypothetical protein